MAQPLDHGLVERLYQDAGAGRWQVPPEDFARALERSAAKALSPAASSREVTRYLQSLHLEDLALACACAAGREPAWDHFVKEYRPTLYRAADAVASGADARELADTIYGDLFSRSLFLYFHGRSSLATWLRAVLAQRRVDLARAAARTAPLPDEARGLPVPPARDPDRGRHLGLMADALRAAMRQLDPRDRLRLRYYYAQGLTLAETGRLLREHEASVSRRLAAARKALRRDIERRLRDAGLDAAEVERCFESVSEDAGPLDLDTLLDDATPARNPRSDVPGTDAAPSDGRVLTARKEGMRR